MLKIASVSALALSLLGLVSQAGWAQVVINQQGVAVSIGQSEARNESGVIGEDVEIEGIVIINGQVSIDGVAIPRGTRKYRSEKSGKVYRIDWGKGDNVSVSEQ